MTASVTTIQRTAKLAPRMTALQTLARAGALLLRRLEDWGVRYYEAGGRGRPI